MWSTLSSRGIMFAETSEQKSEHLTQALIFYRDLLSVYTKRCWLIEILILSVLNFIFCLCETPEFIQRNSKRWWRIIIHADAVWQIQVTPWGCQCSSSTTFTHRFFFKPVLKVFWIIKMRLCIVWEKLIHSF